MAKKQNADDSKRRPMTVTEFARLGGLAAMAKLTPEQRSANARKAIMARWAKVRKAKESAA